MNTQFKSWNLDGEIERAAWNQLDSNYFFASTNKGLVYYMDMRQDGSPVWSKQMHDEEASGIYLTFISFQLIYVFYINNKVL